MSAGGEAADQAVVLTLKALDVTLRLTGSGVITLATLIKHKLEETEDSPGKVKLKTLLQSGKELYVFSLEQKDLVIFAKEAKNYGIQFAAVNDENGIDTMSDIIVKAEDSFRINRLVKRYKLATYDIGKINPDEKEKEPEENQESKETENVLEVMMQNPQEATMGEAQSPLPHTSEQDTNEFAPIRKSVREELQEIKDSKSLTTKEDESLLISEKTPSQKNEEFIPIVNVVNKEKGDSYESK